MTASFSTKFQERLTDTIRYNIWAGELEPGQRLREIPLAKKYGVSRGPIRDVFLQLTREGLLHARPNAGVSVAPAPSDFKRKTLVQLRRKIESDALDYAFDHGIERLIKSLRENLSEYEWVCREGKIENVVRIDLAFHRLIVESADEGSLSAVWLPVISQMFLRYSRHHYLIESYEEHLAVINAIEDGNLQIAKRLLRNHIV